MNHVNNHELNRFAHALRQQESGGDYVVWSSLANGALGHAKGAYQFIDDTWQRALLRHRPELGKTYPQAHLAPDEVQDEIAYAEFSRLYNKLGSWFAVALAWHAGEATAHEYIASGTDVLNGLNDGLIDTRDYAAKILKDAGLSSDA